MKKLFEDLINEVERPRMPDEQKFVAAHKVVKTPAPEDDTNKPNEDKPKDKTRRADPAQGEDEAKYQELQPDDKSAKAFAAYARKVRENAQRSNETTGGNNVEYAHEVYVGGSLFEGSMAHGILDRDPAKAKEARKKLKILLSKPLPATVAADKIYPLFFADDLFDELDFAEKDGSKDVRAVVQSFLKKYKIDLSEGFTPAEFVSRSDGLLEYYTSGAPMAATPMSVGGDVRCGRFEAVTSYRNQVSNVLSDMILTRRTLSSLYSGLCWQIGRTDMGAEACEALETIVTTHNALLQDLLAFEEEYCSQDFIKGVRADLGIQEVDLDDILDDEGEDE